MSPFTSLPDLAVRTLGGSVVAASDESFEEKENLINPWEPEFRPGTFGPRGQEYDGWETARRRPDENGDLGHDWAIVRLGLPGVIRCVVVDTSWFKGNFPPHVSVDACAVDGHPSPAELGGATGRRSFRRARSRGTPRTPSTSRPGAASPTSG